MNFTLTSEAERVNAGRAQIRLVLPATLYMEALLICSIILAVGFLCGVGATLFALYWLGDKLPEE